ncbi:MAG TPA: aldose 1-epimerase family protein [Acidimicrobiales bacterium]|nr:aldose 1-epimerase family protein [Acidimicrobiales bacterium]
MSSADLPTGAQYEIRHGGHRAVITEVGATLRHYSVEGRDVIEDFPSGQMCPAGHGQVLAPWPNRLQGGTYRWAGTTRQLPLSEPSRHNAIHGLVRWQAWVVTEQAGRWVTLTHRIHPRDGYPFLIDIELRYELDESGLTVSATAINRGPEPAPFGLGFHPYLRLGTGMVDGLILECPAAITLITDDAGIPTGRQAVEGTAFDFRSPRAIGALELDTAYTDLSSGSDGLHRVSLSGPGPAPESTTVWMDAGFGHVMVFSGDTLGPERRRKALAVEPMTCPPNALATGEAVISLEPGVTWAGRWGIQP